MSEVGTSIHVYGLDTSTLARAFRHTRAEMPFAFHACGPRVHALEYYDAPSVDLESMTRRHRATAWFRHLVHKGVSSEVEQLWHHGDLLYSVSLFEGELTLFTSRGGRSVHMDASSAEAIQHLVAHIHQVRANFAESLGEASRVIPRASNPKGSVQWYMEGDVGVYTLMSPERRTVMVKTPMPWRQLMSWREAPQDWGDGVRDEVSLRRAHDVWLNEAWEAYKSQAS